MESGDPYQAFLNLADEILINRRSERDLARFTIQLPPVNVELLNELGQQAEEMAIREPRRGWAVTRVAYSAATAQKQDIFSQSLAAWYLGRACNHWGQPKLVRSAISRARRGFLKLNEMGWVAACDWQLNVLSWTGPDIPKAVATLQHALTEFERTGFDEFAPHCRAALAYAQLLIGNFGDARGNIQACEAAFTTNGDELNRARCWLTEASGCRRKGQIEEAFQKLDPALTVFENLNASVDLAKAYYQLGLCHLVKADDLPKAADQFNRAIGIFTGCDMDLWKATCINNLGYVNLLLGSLRNADQHFTQARKSFARHQALGPLADNLNDNGKLNALIGFPAISIEQFKSAEKLYDRLDMKLSAAIARANLGESYGLVGRYQDALHHLEWAAQRFQILNNPLRLAACEQFTALIWARLGQLEVALEHLDKAATCYEDSNQRAMLSSIYNDRASIFFRQSDPARAVDCLRMSLDSATASGVRPQAAIARRLLGEALSQAGENEKALDYLNQAHSDFVDMGMVSEQAGTLVAMGMHYAGRSMPGMASSTFENALKLSEEMMPEIEWKAHAGLASLAEAQGNFDLEFDAHRRAMDSLRRIRLNFWQPDLAGSYLHIPSFVFGKAIACAARINKSEEALKFIEQNKAVTLLNQLEMPKSISRGRKSREVIGLRAEINWLLNQLRTSFDSSNPLKFAVQSRQLRSQLKEKVKLYDALVSRLERRKDPRQMVSMAPSTFNLTRFRKLAGTALGRSWIALDYYMTKEDVFIIVITSDRCEIYRNALTNRFAMALDTCAMNRKSTALPPRELKILGDFLIPSNPAEFLTPQTHLLIAPHKDLHSIPWAAIQRSAWSKPLVCRYVPSVVPSLHSLCILWRRNQQEQALDRGNGLLIGVSNFHNSNQDLPHVNDEMAALSRKLGPGGKLLVESEATWQNLKQVQNPKTSVSMRKGKSRFTWLHLATHFLTDPQTGRLSRIRLWDSDVWLDQLRDLSPLPSLATFSACNSIFSFVHEGDEHIGLPSTCFVAGASTIVGSARPILDEAAAKFTISFYDYYFKGLNPAQAVTRAQRKMIEKGERIDNWASFVCNGVP